MTLKQSQYSREEIILAFMKAKTYEGLMTNKFETVLDTFIQFLENEK